MNDDKLVAVDLFSGAGGLSLGFLQTDQIQIIAAVENNKSAQKTYRRNHPSVKNILGDIRNLDYSEIIKECKKKIKIMLILFLVDLRVKVFRMQTDRRQN